MRLVWKLLRKHISIQQFVGFFLANIVGMLVILLGLQFYLDVQNVFNGKDALVKSDYMIVNKRVGTMTTLLGKDNSFSKKEIGNIEDEGFVEKVGAFTPSAFDVSASLDIKGMRRLSTDMFFESVPDGFVDVKSDKWTFKEGERNIPIILPRDYLDLYNFGYAQSRSLPKLSEGLIGALTLSIRITGNGITDEYTGEIVGFSSRLNTILVPQSFMHWANSHYAPSASKSPTRLILELNNPTDSRIATWLKDNNYSADSGKLEASKTTYVLRIITGIVIFIGAIICVLSLYLLMLSIWLLVEKNNQKLQNLMLLGYSAARVALPYQIIAIGLNAVVLVLAFILLIIIRSIYLHGFTTMFADMQPASTLLTIIVGVLVLLFVSAVNIVEIRRKITSIKH